MRKPKVVKESCTSNAENDLIRMDLLLKILMAANRFDMPGLVSLCIEDIKPDLRLSSACEVLRIAALIDHTDLKKHCMKFIFENRLRLGSELNTLSKDLLLQLLTFVPGF